MNNPNLKKYMVSVIFIMTAVLFKLSFMIYPAYADTNVAGTLVYSGPVDGTNIGLMTHDGISTNGVTGTDIPNIKLDIFGALTLGQANNGIAYGSMVYFYFAETEKGGIVPIDLENEIVSSGNEAAYPRFLIIKSHDGTAFSFRSIYVNDYIGSNSPIKFEGFRNGFSTGSDIMEINQESYDETFTLGNQLTQSKFQNVDEIRITNQCEGDMVWGIYALFNNIEIGNPVIISSDAGLTSVLGQAVTAGAEAGTNAAPKIATVNVANEVATAAAGDIVPHDAGATVTFFGKDSTFSTPQTGSVSLVAAGATNIYIKVQAADGTTLHYKVTVNRAAPAPVYISAAAVTMTAPSAGASPQTAAQAETETSNADYTVTDLIWNEALTAGSKFKAGPVYTATIILTSKNGKEFQAAAFTPAVAGASSVGTTTTAGTGTGNTVSFTVTFPATAAPSVTGIAVKTQPTKLTYTAGETLDLSGMAATLTYNDGSTADIAYAQFGANSITESPANGTVMSVATHNGNPVTVTCNGQPATTSNLTVNAPVPADILAASVSGMLAPAAGAAPVTMGDLTAGAGTYTVTGLAWKDSDGTTPATLTLEGKFKADWTYKAVIELTSAAGNKFEAAGLTPVVDAGTAEAGTVSGGNLSGNKLTFGVTFAATAPKSITGISVSTQPAKMSYTEGIDETLALNGMVIIETYNDGSAGTVNFTDGTAPGYAASPVNGATLTRAAHNNTTVTVTHMASAQTAQTGDLIVNAPPLSSDAGLTSVLGQAVTAGAEAGTILAPKTATVNVVNEVAAAAAGDIVPHDAGATVTFYGKDSTFSTPETGSVSLAAGGATNIYIKVQAADGTTRYYKVTVNRRAASSNGGSAGSAQPAVPTQSSGAGAEILINGKTETAATAATRQDGGQTVTIVIADDKKLAERLLQVEGNGAIVTMFAENNPDVVIGQLNGQTVKNMETKEAVLEIKMDNVIYTLPASQINIANVSAQIGQQVALSDIMVNVRISSPSQDTVKILEDTANKNSYQVVVGPIEFNITCSGEGKTVEVSKFNGYVERMVAIPDGIDPDKITTGIVLNSDGTFSHVPTVITIINGKYYAKINSLTNSTYSVIYSPKAFKDVENHWAKDAVNNMASRLVVSGVGNNLFEPDRDITRGEFAAIVVKALGLMRPGTGKVTYNDVAQSDWYFDPISIASDYNIIAGYGSGKFGPQDNISREQAMTMIARAMQITGLKSEIKDSEMNPLMANYADGAAASAYAKVSIAACLKTGVIKGRGNSIIAPKENITRAEAAVAVQMLLQKSNLI